MAVRPSAPATAAQVVVGASAGACLAGTRRNAPTCPGPPDNEGDRHEHGQQLLLPASLPGSILS
jgi:hypothetical protein